MNGVICYTVSKEEVREKRPIDIAGKFLDKAERKMAKELLEKYLEDFTIETVSEINTLQEIIYLEVCQLRVQAMLNDFQVGETKSIPINLMDVLHKNSEVIIKLKNTLGLNRTTKLHGYDALEHLKKRHTKWREENQGSRHIKCPYCKKFVWLKIRTEAWEALQHPFFKDTFLCNKPLLDNLGKDVKIDRDFLAKVFGTSPDYIDWLVTKLGPGSDSA